MREIKESVLSSQDGRLKVEEDTGCYPRSLHGHMVMVYLYGYKKNVHLKKTYVGSGIMVNHSHVLTAGHNLYSKGNGGIPHEVFFYPGRQGTYKPWALTGKSFKIHPQYYENEDYDHDLALLTLEESEIGFKTGWARLNNFNDKNLLKETVTVTGYPHEKFEGVEPYMYTLKELSLICIL